MKNAQMNISRSCFAFFQGRNYGGQEGGAPQLFAQILPPLQTQSDIKRK